MLDKVLLTLSHNGMVDKGDTVIAAVSGGPDSVCLLHLLHSLSKKLEINVHAIHINHMLRGSESDQDELYVRQLCETLGVPLRVCPADIVQLAKETGMSIEEAGREVRYCEFEAYAADVGAQKIAVAHNRNDQAETVMMHIIRGSGLTGLVGMEYIRGRIIRPLLDINRSQIEQYCSENGLNPRIDSSNLKSDYARNRVRLELLPLINLSFGSDITGSLCKLSSLAAQDNSFLEESASKAFDECILKKENPTENHTAQRILLDVAKLARLHPALLGRVLRRAVCCVQGDMKGVERVHIDAVEDLVRNGRTGAVIQLPGKVRAAMSYGELKIFIEKVDDPFEDFNKEIIIPGTTRVESVCGLIEAEIEDCSLNIDKYGKIGYNSLVQYFDYNLVKEGIYVRNRQEGDIFRPFGSKGSKKLKEYLIDSKIPKEIRKKIPLAAVGKDIVWIVGYKTSDKFRVTENTKRVLKLKYIN